MKTIKIKDFLIEIPNEGQCNSACNRCCNSCGIRNIRPSDFINNFVEINQANGFFVGFEKYEVEDGEEYYIDGLAKYNNNPNCDYKQLLAEQAKNKAYEDELERIANCDNDLIVSLEAKIKKLVEYMQRIANIKCRSVETELAKQALKEVNE